MADMTLQERTKLLHAVTDPAARSLLFDLYEYVDRQNADLELIHRAVGFARWLGPMAVAVGIFVMGRVW